MNLEALSIKELIQVYTQSIKELKKRGVLRTKNVVGEIGQFLVLETYEANPNLPKLTPAPVGTKNISAISQSGERYAIKTTSGSTAGVFYGLEPLGSDVPDKQLFEYVIVCKLDEDSELEGIYEFSWDTFMKYKRWHTRMKAWNIPLTKETRNASRIIYERSDLSA